jgi:hypothetical protein
MNAEQCPIPADGLVTLLVTLDSCPFVPVATTADTSGARAFNFSTAPDISKMRGSVYTFIVNRISVCRIKDIATRGAMPALASRLP